MFAQAQFASRTIQMFLLLTKQNQHLFEFHLLQVLMEFQALHLKPQNLFQQALADLKLMHSKLCHQLHCCLFQKLLARQVCRLAQDLRSHYRKTTRWQCFRFLQQHSQNRSLRSTRQVCLSKFLHC